MIIKELKLKNFRNYKDLKVSFNDKLNVFIGDNAQGKTNILEAIYILALTKSFLNINDKDLINFDESCSFIDGVINGNDEDINLRVKINDVGKYVYINNVEINRIKDYISKFNVLIFSPDNIRMIKDGPAARRKFLNVELSQLFYSYVDDVNKFNKVLKIRNEILKSDNINMIYLDIINDNYCSLWVNIFRKRRDFINELNDNIDVIFEDISSLSGLSIKYMSSIDEDTDDLKDILKVKISEALDKERKYGSSLYGPHRDDFHFYLNDKDISMYGSQGQMRMAILSLKLAEISVFERCIGKKPILLLDDIFSELDIGKRNNLIKYINGEMQTIITTTDLNMIDDSLLRNATIYEINDGKIINVREMEYNG